MIVNYFGITEKGNFRSHNEDSMYVSGEIVAGTVSGSFSSSGMREAPLILALADGMGGHISGEIASRMTLEKLAWTERAVQPLDELSRAGWQSLFSIINHEINDYAKETGKLGMGATLVGILFGKRKVLVFNMGDSRAYHFSSQGIQKITVDHSFAGPVKENQVSRSYITSCIGGGTTDLQMDLFDITNSLNVGDRILLCTDGLTDVIKIDDLEEILKNSSNAKEACYHLLEEANLRMTKDNTSVIVIEVQEIILPNSRTWKFTPNEKKL
ncbi:MULTISPECIES: PP2C family protein-serine/threonine phosphatase [Leptospira]|uniref:Protein phosphatase n=2 Tax=Leptospira kirschneri TaxID=29507 RepID=A0A1T1DIU5_9LEPT|nr:MULTISPECIES: protein phosphatase 2C domain-containing protein [Leptospira]EMO75998.1 stage II sporulation protein E [Leptospira kirschneri str. 200801925]EJO69225.1 stage II sporulation protein E [Leptospira kirschneri serovar Grippotyphosa str. RM52]EKO53090.1 stage II sporulation protein E [Leptospira kirschneri str. 200802841]EKP03870.1 stage II sporulation protein E [Leptospira kirschneri str. 2008720114]EKQ82766.1 stage II sporulation protein E [Leptospira kirschneri serovar Grippotyp